LFDARVRSRAREVAPRRAACWNIRPVSEDQSNLAKERTPSPHSRRAREIVASLRASEPSSAEVFDAFWELDKLPVDEVREAMAEWVGPLPERDRLDAATRRAHGLPMRRLRLRTLSIARDADVLDLGPIAEEQLRLAGKSWDGADLAPEERLDGEVEGSFAGTVARRVLADADAPDETPLFDVLSFAGDSGVVFAAGTTNVVALIAYHKVEMKDRRTRVALQEALDASDDVSPEATPVSPIVEAAPEERTEPEVASRDGEVAVVQEEQRVETIAIAPKETVAKATKKTAKKTVAKATKKTAKKTVAKATKNAPKKKGVKPASKTPKKVAKSSVKSRSIPTTRGAAKTPKKRTKPR
jgi:hypothetical protein